MCIRVQLHFSDDELRYYAKLINQIIIINDLTFVWICACCANYLWYQIISFLPDCYVVTILPSLGLNRYCIISHFGFISSKELKWGISHFNVSEEFDTNSEKPVTRFCCSTFSCFCKLTTIAPDICLSSYLLSFQKFAISLLFNIYMPVDYLWIVLDRSDSIILRCYCALERTNSTPRPVRNVLTGPNKGAAVTCILKLLKYTLKMLIWTHVRILWFDTNLLWCFFINLIISPALTNKRLPFLRAQLYCVFKVGGARVWFM